MRTALAIFALLLAGCSVPAPAPQSARVMPMPAMVEAPTAPVAGETVTLVWDASPTVGVTDYKVYRWTTGETNTVMVSGTSTTVHGVQMPESFIVTAVLGDEESLPSNLLRILGKDEIVQIIALTNSAAGLSDWTQAGVVFTGTNVTGNGFWKLEATNQSQLRTESTE